MSTLRCNIRVPLAIDELTRSDSELSFVVFDVKAYPGLQSTYVRDECVMANASSSSEKAGAWDFTS
jgi:hypothetical protein